MNTKARKVRADTIDRFSPLVAPEDFYVTKTVEQSDECLAEILQKRIPLVFCGGGDGTAMRIIEQLQKRVDSFNASGGDFVLPKIGILKLGTGNGWAGLLKTPPIEAPIHYVKTGRALRFTRFNMLRQGDRLAHMAGVGIDAGVLNNYIDLKNRFKEGFLWKLANSLVGYLWATFLISVPQFVRKGYMFNVRVINESDGPIYKVSQSEGIRELPLKKGETIFEGKLMMIGFGTTPNYGFNLVAFPFALWKPGYMNLRLVANTIPQILVNVPSVWKGAFEDEKMMDYLVTKVRIESETDLPLQLGGDPEGYRRSLDMEVAQETVEVLDFR